MAEIGKASGGRTRRGAATTAPRAAARGGAGRTAKVTAGAVVQTPAPAPAPAATIVPAAAPPPAAGFHDPAIYVVRPGEDPWNTEELTEVHGGLSGIVRELRAEIALAENGMADLLRDSGEGAGDDQADTGTKNFEREHEMSLTNNARGMLLQSEKALRRLADGTYGACETCASPIGKARLQAFPRATLCVTCKQREERR